MEKIKDEKITDTKPKWGKLWEEMSVEEQRAIEEKWRQKAADFHAGLIKQFWEGQSNLKLLRGRECESMPVRSGEPATVSSTPLPDEPGYYLWYVLDWGYLDVGMIHVLKDPEKHRAYLKEQYDKGSRNFLMYQNSKGETLTMYHEGDHMPYRNNEGVPWVDGYAPINFDIFK